MVPKRFIRRLETLSKRQAKVRDDLRELESEVGEYVDHNDDAAERLAEALEALSRLA